MDVVKRASAKGRDSKLFRRFFAQIEAGGGDYSVRLSNPSMQELLQRRAEVILGDDDMAPVRATVIDLLARCRAIPEPRNLTNRLSLRLSSIW